MELIDTIKGMASTDYRERFEAEYSQLIIRINKLSTFIAKIENGDNVKHDCPVALLKRQLKHMNDYRIDLEEIMIYEGIIRTVEEEE